MADDKIHALTRHTLKGSALTFAAQGLQFTVKIATQILIARLLVPADYGLIAMVTPVTSLSQLVGDMGMAMTTVIQRDITDAETSALLWFQLGLNCTLAAGLMVAAPGIAWVYGEPRVLPITIAMAGLLPVTGSAVQHVTRLWRNMRYGALAVIDVVPPTAALAVGLTAARAGWGYWSLVAAVAADTISHAGLAWALSGWRPMWPRRDMRIGRLLRVGMHFTISNFTGYLTTSVDNVLLGVFKGSDALGLYNRGYRMVTQPVLQLLVPMGRVAIPVLTRLLDQPGRYRGAWRDLVSSIVLVGVPGILWVMTMAHPLVSLVLGPQWVDAAPVISWLCLGALASPIIAGAQWLFVTQHHTKRQMHYNMVTSAIAVTSFIIGLPWGPVGVSAATALSFVTLSMPLTCWAATRDSFVGVPHLIRTLAPLIAATSATYAAVDMIAAAWAPEGALGIMGMLGLNYGVFAGLLSCLPFGQSLIRRIWRLRTTLRQREA